MQAMLHRQKAAIWGFCLFFGTKYHHLQCQATPPPAAADCPPSVELLLDKLLNIWLPTTFLRMGNWGNMTAVLTGQTISAHTVLDLAPILAWGSRKLIKGSYEHTVGAERGPNRALRIVAPIRVSIRDEPTSMRSQLTFDSDKLE